MKKETWQKIKEEFPLVFVATAVSLLASALYHSLEIPIIKLLQTLFYIIVTTIISLVIIYLGIYIYYRNSNRIINYFRKK